MVTNARAMLVAGMLCGFGRLAAAQQQPLAGSAVEPPLTPALVALGDSVFHGKAGGGTCFVCHGADAKGTPGLAPDLTRPKLLNGDGSYAFIVKLVQTGVPNPKEAPAPMPAMGGVNLTPEQVRAVAAYVYSLRTAKGHSGP
jgi:mono/diheme cytochrome c family protein